MLATMARTDPAVGQRRVKPSVYLRPTAQAISQAPARSNKTQDMLIATPPRSHCRLPVRRTRKSSESGAHHLLTDKMIVQRLRNLGNLSSYDLMVTLSGMAPFVFLGNSAWLDYVDTELTERGERVELVGDFEDLLRWGRESGLLSESEARHVEAAAPNAGRREALVREAYATRSALRGAADRMT